MRNIAVVGGGETSGARVAFQRIEGYWIVAFLHGREIRTDTARDKD